MPESYVKQGYVREELSTVQKCRDFERETGRIQEALHYNSNTSAEIATDRANEAATNPTIPHDPAIRHKLAEALQ